MKRNGLARLSRMDGPEIAWRGQAAARIALDRLRTVIREPSWKRERLSGILARLPHLTRIQQALTAKRWNAAHIGLSQHFVEGPQGFVISPALRRGFTARILAEFPTSAVDAACRADRIVNGDYDLLGYKGLRFESEGAVDWHYDPVHDRRAPVRFWSKVPFLDPACGDHKVIWELNRHQHWLSLGRAYWLTGEARYRDRAISELAGWLEANPPCIGVNWASMLELAFRSLSWIWAINLFADPDHADDHPWLVDMLVALDRQLEHIEHNLSYYYSPNTHLLGEALALYVSGRSLPLLRASARRQATGRRILLAEAARQIANDGGHRERSTHYHRYTLDFYLLALAIARVTGDEAAVELEQVSSRLASAARLLADDSGRLPHIGDDDGGCLMPLTGRAVDDIRDSLAAASAILGRPDLRVTTDAPEEPYWLLAHPVLAGALSSLQQKTPREPVASGALPDTGYYVSRSAGGDHLVIDAGAHGYQNGGHAHADALSLTLSVSGVPLLIDTGTGCYTVDSKRRDWLRSTPSHNTLTLDDRSQSIPMGPFHWLHAAAATLGRWRTNPGFDYFEASHDGYRPVEHRRHLLFLHGDLLIVADLVIADGPHEAAVHWHLHPGWRVSAAGQRALMTAEGTRCELFVSNGTLTHVLGDADSGLGWYSPVYGAMEPTSTLRIRRKGIAPLWIVSVFGLDDANHITAIETAPVWAEAGMLTDSTGLRISRAESTDFLLLANPVANGTGTWRLGEFETDARLLFVRAQPQGAISRVALVDGSLVRVAGGQRLLLTLPRRATDLQLDLCYPAGNRSAELPQARLSGPLDGARVQIAGRDLSVEGQSASADRSRARRT